MQKTGNYPIVIFMPFFNLLCGILLIDFISIHIKKDDFYKIVDFLFFSIVGVLIYCVLQRFNLDQFYKSANPAFPNRDEMVGVIGNTMHNSHYLAMTLPLLFKNKLLTLLGLGIICLTGSSSGILIALILIVFYSCFKRIFTLRESILLAILGVLFIVWKFPNVQNLLSSSGRFELWKHLFPIFSSRPITGSGLGTINAISKSREFIGWRHTHLEMYHYAIELGLIGLGIILWGIKDVVSRFIKSDKDVLDITMFSVFLGFFISSMFGYPSHLWLLASVGIVSYSYFYITEVKIADFKGN